MNRKTAEVANLLLIIGLVSTLFTNLYLLKQSNVRFHNLLKLAYEDLEIIERINEQNMEDKKRAYADFQEYYDILTNHKNISREYISGLSVMLFERYDDVCRYVPSDEIGTKKYDVTDALKFVDASAEEQKTYLQRISKQTKICFEYKE